MIEKPNNTIVTSADAYYFRTMCQFIYTFHSQKEYKNSKLICYDMGFDEEQLAYFEKLKTKVPNLSIRKFDFEAYPDFVGLEYKTYSFKPIIVKEVFDESNGNVLWLDSATILFKPLTYVWDEITKYSIYAPIGGSGTLKEWTVQETMDYMNAPKEDYSKRNICGCMCGFGHQSTTVRLLVSEWERYSLIHECIKPQGAGRANHRDDQSLLTILLYKAQREENLYLTKDEVNISSSRPIDYLSVRNKLNPNFPYLLNPISVLYYTVYKTLDVLINRMKS